MIVKVHEHNIKIVKSPVNELEVNITKIQFEFDEVIPSNYVKKAFFSNSEASIEITLENNECNIPSEVLTKKGQVRLGVIAYEIQDHVLVERFNPRPAYFEVWEGSLIEADNTEPITPTDKEQIEQQLLDITNQMDNLDIDAEKVEHITTITITDKEGNTKEVQVLDGDQGPQGEPGQPGAIKMVIVEELPETGSGDTLYFVPKEDAETSDLYDEYAWVNNAWELLGTRQITVDLTDYVKNTDWANNSKGGVFKTSNTNYGTYVNPNNGILSCETKNYTAYSSASGNLFVSKGTLENVITGKGLVSNTDYASDNVGGVIRANSSYGLAVSNGALYCIDRTYAQYGSMWTNAFISKGTLENVLDARIGDIDSVIDAINGEVI